MYDKNKRLPEFSIVITAYNRERYILRAIQSCIQQNYDDFEVIVVDDCCTDNTYKVASASGDSRVRIIRHSSNRGGTAGRNTGALAAKGAWVIHLDSDDEILPGALKTIAHLTSTAPEDVSRFNFMFQRDDGRVSPSPVSGNQVVGYAGYLRWLDGLALYDFLPCTKRDTFETVRYPENRWSDQFLYHLDFARVFRTALREEIVAMVHTDAANRSSYLRRDSKYSRSNAAELGKDMDALFARHEAALRHYAPRLHKMFRRMRTAYHFLAGERRAGVRQGLECIRATPLLPEPWLLLGIGVVNAKALATVRSWKGPAN